LDVVQEKRIRPIGSNSFQSVDCRVIAATNKPVAPLLASGKLRRDLFHRIAHYTITLPPLRHRLADIPHLAGVLLERFREREGVSVFDITSDAVNALQCYAWPGNVRELQAVVEGAAYFARHQGRTVIERNDLRLGDQEGQVNSSKKLAFSETVEAYKAKLVREALARADGNQVQAARELGLDRGTLRRIIGRTE
jgi:transcriptional regulator with PAS, ATPase and Fis domain